MNARTNQQQHPGQSAAQHFEPPFAYEDNSDANDSGNHMSGISVDSIINQTPQKTSQNVDKLPLPLSVKGAPEELKPAIRKQQNKESARRSRQRRQQLMMQMATSIGTMADRIRLLESRVVRLENSMQKHGFTLGPSVQQQQEQPFCTSAGISKSHQQHIGHSTGKQYAKTTEPIDFPQSDQRVSHNVAVSPRTQSSSAGEAEEEEHMQDDDEQLIQRCLDQIE